MILNLPNIISLSRIAISPLFYFMILSNDPLIQQLACLLFLLGAVSDYIDGWYARRYNEVTNWGKFVDPLADKFLTTSAFLAFVSIGIIPLWMVVLIIFRDFGTTFLRIFAEWKSINMKTSFTAKAKTFAQMLFIGYLLALIFIKDANSAVANVGMMNNLIYSDLSYYSMLLITLLTFWTMLEYLWLQKELIKSLKESLFSKYI